VTILIHRCFSRNDMAFLHAALCGEGDVAF